MGNGVMHNVFIYVLTLISCTIFNIFILYIHKIVFYFWSKLYFTVLPDNCAWNCLYCKVVKFCGLSLSDIQGFRELIVHLGDPWYNVAKHLGKFFHRTSNIHLCLSKTCSIVEVSLKMKVVWVVKLILFPFLKSWNENNEVHY